MATWHWLIVLLSVLATLVVAVVTWRQPRQPAVLELGGGGRWPALAFVGLRWSSSAVCVLAALVETAVVVPGGDVAKSYLGRYTCKSLISKLNAKETYLGWW